MLTKLQTTSFIRNLIHIMSSQSGASNQNALIFYLQQKIMDKNFCLNDIDSWIDWLNEINQHDHQGVIAYQICKDIVNNKSFDVFKNLSSICQLINSEYLNANLNNHNKKIIIEFFISKQVNTICFSIEDTLLIIKSVANFLNLTRIEEYLNDLPEDIVYRLNLPWRHQSNFNCVINNPIFKSWLQQGHLDNYAHMLKHLNSLLHEWDVNPIREPHLHKLNITLFNYWIGQLLTTEQLKKCLAFISYFENNLIQKYSHIEKSNIHFPLTITNQTSQSIALIDIEKTLVLSKDDIFIYNQGLISALKASGIKQIYLFSDNPCNENLFKYIEHITQTLAQEGIRIFGALTPLDMVGDIELHELIYLYELLIQHDRYDILIERTGVEIFRRLLQGYYPPHQSNFYRKQKEIFSMLEINHINCAKFNSEANLALLLIRKLATLVIDRKILTKGIYNIKGFLFEQFLLNNYNFDHIYVFDSSEPALRSIENVFQYYNPSRISLNTIHINTKIAFDVDLSEEYVAKIESRNLQYFTSRDNRFFEELAQLPIREPLLSRRSIFNIANPKSSLRIVSDLLKEYIASCAGPEKYKNFLSLQVMLDNIIKNNSSELTEHYRLIVEHFPEFKSSISKI